MLKLLPLLLFLSSCTLGPGIFESRYSGDLERRSIRRIAVLPPEAKPVAERAPSPYVSPPAAPLKEEAAASVLSDHIYSTMASFAQWQIVSEREVREAVSMIPKGSEAARAKNLGELVHADAVVSSKVLRYRERVGEEWGAKSPASVSFVMELWDVKRGEVVWSGRFDETQRALSENIFALFEFTQRGVRWLKAEELALEGVKKAVADLHQALYRGIT
ncbi:MAG: hypothetical protein HYT78_05955 [Deltaproteobacteria bacterium]|nr:hypothetical protein [Deltaproteobacteria bacterium]